MLRTSSIAVALGLLPSLLLAAGCFVTVNQGDPGDGGLPALCSLPQEVGPCEAAIPMYWHDPDTGVCKLFSYGGCDGNANRFGSFEACQEACHGGSPDMDACEAPGDCVLAAAGNCPPCDTTGAGSLVAVNRAMKDEYDRVNPVSSVVCEACPDVSEPERRLQYAAATCESGRCVVRDVRESPLTECTEDAECALRDGVGCCEGCDGTGIVALNQSADLRSLVCPADAGACPPCAPVYPDGMTAVCSAGRCQPRLPAAP
ncbi:BPTI/Kunitz domain-containing protein [Sorangium sp. So ce394]|uniref:BPTI/Kunitz domain-containing protein n=1 Tax=Sorangium sp. So ce394 TaxID=3133310 RepID=UPI003F5C08A8